MVQITTCLLHVGPPFGNRFLNTSWAVGVTYWIVYLHFFLILTYAFIYVLIHHIIFWLYLYFLNILYFFKYSCTNIFHRCSLCTFYSNRPVSYIPQCTSPISHTAAFRNWNVQISSINGVLWDMSQVHCRTCEKGLLPLHSIPHRIYTCGPFY